MATWKLTRMQFMTLQKLFEQIEMTSSDFSARGLHDAPLLFLPENKL